MYLYHFGEKMNKRKERNRIVRTAITDAVFELMKQKQLDDITVTEIIQKAQVARISFYRNYESKEAVLAGLVEDALEDFKATADYDLLDCYSVRHVSRCLEYFKKYRDYVLNLHYSGYSGMILTMLNQFHEITAGSMALKSAERYKLYIFIGALYNTAIVWIREGSPEPINVVAEIIADSLQSVK